MKKSNLKDLYNVTEKIGIFASSILFLYFLCSLYFMNHFFFHTEINEADVSLKSHSDVDRIVRGYMNDYELVLILKDGKFEKISGQEIGMKYHNCSVNPGKHKPFQWIRSIWKHKKYYVEGLFSYDSAKLNSRIEALNCLNKDIIEPQNVSFNYSGGSYEIIAEIDGNKINKERLSNAVSSAVLHGKVKLDLSENQCYDNPEYTLASGKTKVIMNLLNRYVTTKIVYKFGNANEILDGNTIHEWLRVDENLEIVINGSAIADYVNGLSSKYNTIGAARSFKTSMGNVIEVKGGLYGWKINKSAEINALIDMIKQGQVIEREPIYSQKALVREENDIGNTYVEINITKQQLWFYKEGKLIAQGAVVTGNPNKGNSTVLGTYMINYKENGSTLSGANYNVRVSYWMPFYGNIGIHDARWRHSFGGEIYKRNGTHGCVNAPFYLAKTIYENIEKGTPVICYKE